MSLNTRQFERAKYPESNIQVMAPVGLQDLSKRIITKALEPFDQQSRLLKIRVLPVAGAQEGEAAAAYQLDRDRIDIKIPMNLLIMSYLQRAIARIDDFTVEVIPRLSKLSEKSLEVLGMNKKLLIKVITASSKKPEYRPETPEQYNINRKYDIAKKALDIYHQFVLAFDKNLSSQLTASDLSSLITFVHFIEEYLGNVSDQETADNLQKLQHLPYGYSLFCMLHHCDPHTLEISNELAELVTTSVQHEKIHQILCMLYPDFRKEIEVQVEQRVVSETEHDDQPVEDTNTVSEEQWKIYEAHSHRLSQCLMLSADVIDQVRTLPKIYDELLEINLTHLNDLTTLIEPDEALSGYILNCLDTGYQEAAIAILMGHKENRHFIANLYPYITKLDFLLPPLPVLEKMEAIAKKHDTKIQSAIDEISRDIFDPNQIKVYGQELFTLIKAKKTASNL